MFRFVTLMLVLGISLAQIPARPHAPQVMGTAIICSPDGVLEVAVGPDGASVEDRSSRAACQACLLLAGLLPPEPDLPDAMAVPDRDDPVIVHLRVAQDGGSAVARGPPLMS